jgi:dihydrofolate reductase
MGRIVVTEFVSIDGVMEAPGGKENYAHTGWTFEFPDSGQYVYKLEELQASEALLLGRVTYEGFAAAWPERTDEEGFADKINAMPKYVISSTLEDPTWNNTTVLRGDVAEEISRLKEEVDGDILVNGSAMLVHELLEQGLVDELRLMIFPVILGSGKRVFPNTPEKITMEPVDARTYGEIAVQTYKPAR